MEVEVREAALCIFRRRDAFLVAEIEDRSGSVLHRPPGGGIETGETPEQALRRELYEELGVTLTDVRELGAIDHVWFWNGREVHERAWLFSASSSDPRLNHEHAPELLEANGHRWRTVWRPLLGNATAYPPLCPSGLDEFLRSVL